jgi:molybdate transport system substrate-binding protein
MPVHAFVKYILPDSFDALAGDRFRRRSIVSWAAACVGGWAVDAVGAGRSAPALVAVAASVAPAMEEIVGAWSRATHQKVLLVYGSSGNFTRQILQGLPAELFLSADEGFALKLVEQGWARGDGAIYGSGRVALLASMGSGIRVDPQLKGLRQAWPSVRKFAIANPELAPYGKAAREVLQALGLWDAARDKLVVGENVAQTAQFVTSGAAQAGLTALSLMAAGAGLRGVPYVEVAGALHGPLRQRMVLGKRAGPVATALYDYLQTAPAQAVLRRHGL